MRCLFTTGAPVDGNVHAQNVGTVHVVCHDCSFESLTTDEEEARGRVHRHETETGHAVRFARID
jgi:hypothetical protein